MKKPRVISACLWIMALVWVLPAQAQFSLGTEVTRGIFTMDQEQVFQDTQFGKRLVTEFQNSVDQLNAENDRVAEELRAEEEALTVQRKTMDNAEFRLLAAEFDKKVVAIRDKQRTKERDLSALSDQNRQFFQAQTREIIQTILNEHNVGVLVESRAVIWASPNNDLTNKVIGQIDAELGQGPAQ